MVKKEGLIRKLKSLYDKRHHYITSLEKYTMRELQFRIKIEEALWLCNSCRGQLHIMKLNKHEILVCGNSACDCYRRPAGTVRALAGK